MAIGDAAIVEDLEKDIEDIGVGFFHFVEKHHRVGLAAHSLAELATLLVADIAGRRSDEAGHGVLLHVFGHVEANDGAFVVEEKFREGFGEFCFANACGAEEEERANGAILVLQAGAGAADGIGDSFDGLLLADDALHEAFLHFHELGALAFLETGNRDAGPSGNDFGDVLLGDLLAEDGGGFFLGIPRRSGVLHFFEFALHVGEESVLDLAGAVQVASALGLLEFGAKLLDALGDFLGLADFLFFLEPLGAERGGLLLHLGEFALKLFEALAAGGVFFFFEGLALHLELHDLAFELVDLGRQGFQLDLETGCGLVHEIDRFVRQEAVADVAVAQNGGGDEGGILDAHAVVDFVAFLQSAKNGDGVLDAWLADHHWLEAALEGGVLFDVFAIFVERGRSNGVEFATSELGFQEI